MNRIWLCTGLATVVLAGSLIAAGGVAFATSRPAPDVATRVAEKLQAKRDAGLDVETQVSQAAEEAGVGGRIRCQSSVIRVNVDQVDSAAMEERDKEYIDFIRANLGSAAAERAKAQLAGSARDATAGEGYMDVEMHRLSLGDEQ
jgi:hypothetical protein